MTPGSRYICLKAAIDSLLIKRVNHFVRGCTTLLRNYSSTFFFSFPTPSSLSLALFLSVRLSLFRRIRSQLHHSLFVCGMEPFTDARVPFAEGSKSAPISRTPRASSSARAPVRYNRRRARTRSRRGKGKLADRYIFSRFHTPSPPGPFFALLRFHRMTPGFRTSCIVWPRRGTSFFLFHKCSSRAHRRYHFICRDARISRFHC